MRSKLAKRLVFAAFTAFAAGCGPTPAAPPSIVTPPTTSTTSSSTGSSTTTSTSSSGGGGQCAPCQVDADCGEEGSAICVFESTLPGGHCAPACSASSDCDPGAVCTPTSANLNVCYPASQSCAGWVANTGGSGTTTSSGSTATTGTGATTGGASSGNTSTGGTTTGATTSTSGGASSTGGTTGSSCPGYADPNTPSPCTCPTGHTCTANNCYGGWYCDLSTNRCVAPPSSCGGNSTTGGSTTTSGGTTSGTTSSGGTTSGTTGATTAGGIGPQGGTVNLLHFGMSGDTRPPSCEDTAGYPTAIIDAIGDAERAAGAQFALDLGDHMYVCNNDGSVAQQQMGLFMQGVSHFGGTWFMTEGNHECMGSGSGYCPTGSTNVNYQAFLGALAPISSSPYYSVNIQTSKGLATFVFVADNSWDSNQQAWLEQVLTTADQNATYTFVAKHHPVGDTSVAANTQIIQTIRSHKFTLLLTGHAHKYEHSTADSGRDIVLGNGGAPLVSTGTFNGYALVDQLANGNIQVTVYDVSTGAPQDQWQVGPN